MTITLLTPFSYDFSECFPNKMWKGRLVSEGAYIRINEPHCEKTGLWGFRPGPTQTRLCSH